jgi:glycosyltransferase involved in cell wall biosynthesis
MQRLNTHDLRLLSLAMNPLVSILIPAHNAENCVADTIRSAVAQAWPCKEMIIVDDGFLNRTSNVARGFASRKVVAVSTKNQDAAAARNHALKLCQEDYIQWLDADHIQAPDQTVRLLTALREIDSKRTLLSSAWATFSDRTSHARFDPT